MCKLPRKPQHIYISQPHGILLTNSWILVKHTLRYNESLGWAELAPHSSGTTADLCTTWPCLNIKIFSVSTLFKMLSRKRQAVLQTMTRAARQQMVSPRWGWAKFIRQVGCGSDWSDANPDGSALYTLVHIRAGKQRSDPSPLISLITDYSGGYLNGENSGIALWPRTNTLSCCSNIL